MALTYKMNEYYYYDPAYTAPVVGFHNTGNICWFNSLLQMLLSLPALNRTLLECEPELAKNKFAVEYIRLIKAIGADGLSPHTGAMPALNDAISSASSRILAALIVRLATERPTMRLGATQECADEGFVTFIAMLGCPRVDMIFNIGYDMQVDCSFCQKTVSSTRDTSVRLQLHIPLRPPETQDAFCDWLWVHVSGVDHFKCDHCGRVMANVRRVEKLRQISEILVITFNKFQTKRNIWFPQQLAFRGVNGGTIKYTLVAKIEHAGTMYGGHYWAHVRRGVEEAGGDQLPPNNSRVLSRWFQANDLSVGPGDSEPSAGTFMLAYHMLAPA